MAPSRTGIEPDGTRESDLEDVIDAYQAAAIVAFLKSL